MVTVILCVFLLSYVYSEGKVSKATSIIRDEEKQLTFNLTEQLLQREHSTTHISCDSIRILSIWLLIRYGCHGHR